jgi:hypothetical protein
MSLEKKREKSQENIRRLKIDVYTICWNEQQFLPYFLNYYANIVEANNIYVYDNQSTDESQKIIKSFKNTKLLIYNTGGQIRDDIYLQIKNNQWKVYSRGKADLVIIVDVDEIVYHPNGLRNILEEIWFNSPSVETRPNLISPFGYQMYSKEFPETFTNNPLEISCFGKPDEEFNKMGIFNPNEIQEINYMAGCHRCGPISFENISVLKIFSNSGIKLLHYKYVVGVDYLIERYEQYKKRLSAVNKEKGWGKHYLSDIQQIKENYKEASFDLINIR